jgi:type IV pilus assembly protein PilO
MADGISTNMGRSLVYALLLFIAILGGYYFFSYSSSAEEIAAKTSTRDSLSRSVQGLRVTAAKLPEFTREVSVLESKLEALKQILPPQKETADLMRKVQSIAAQANLGIRKFTPAATVSKDFYQEWPINMEVDGAYHNLGVFFDRVRTLSRLVNFGNLKLTARTARQGGASASRTISASCVATTYVYVDNPTPPPAAAGKAVRRPAPPAAGGAK